MTNDQADAIGRLIKNYSHYGIVTIAVGPATFGLPDDYITFRLDAGGTQALYGGVSPDGHVST